MIESGPLSSGVSGEDDLDGMPLKGGDLDGMLNEKSHTSSHDWIALDLPTCSELVASLCSPQHT